MLSIIRGLFLITISDIRTDAAADANKAAVKDSSLMMDVQEKVLMEKSLYPILLCSAAGTDDLDGMLLLSENYEGMMLMLNCMDYDGRTPLVSI